MNESKSFESKLSEITPICDKWSNVSAISNGTIYYYTILGGQWCVSVCVRRNGFDSYVISSEETPFDTVAFVRAKDALKKIREIVEKSA